MKMTLFYLEERVLHLSTYPFLPIMHEFPKPWRRTKMPDSSLSSLARHWAATSHQRSFDLRSLTCYKSLERLTVKSSFPSQG